MYISHTGLRGLQAEAYKLFARSELCTNLEDAVMKKIVIIVGNDLANTLRADPDWYKQLLKILPGCNSQAKFALLKTYGGA